MDDHLTAVIEQKLTFLTNLGLAGMTWWVSSVVFCGSSLAGIWLNRTDLLKNPQILVSLKVGLFLFFASICVFGAFCAVITKRLEKETRHALSLKPPTPGLAFSEFTCVFWGFVIGTTSFVLVTLAWLALCFII